MSGTRNIVAALCQRWYGGSAEATLVYCLAVGGGGGGGVVATMHWSGRIVYESEFSGRPNPSMDDGQTAELGANGAEGTVASHKDIQNGNLSSFFLIHE